MKRNEVTTVEQLIMGDRFYKLGDNKKKIYEYGYFSSRSSGYLRPHAFVHEVNPNGTINKRDIHFFNDEKVVFLRNTSDKYAEDIRKITHQQDDKGNTDSAL